jgi:hypothetical protein
VEIVPEGGVILGNGAVLRMRLEALGVVGDGFPLHKMQDGAMLEGLPKAGASGVRRGRPVPVCKAVSI